jgi:hypothetical protein
MQEKEHQKQLARNEKEQWKVQQKLQKKQGRREELDRTTN